MSLGIEGLLVFVLVIFPGVIARAEAQRVGAIPEDRIARTWVRELADALSYSLFLAPLAALIGLATLRLTTGGSVGPLELVRSGPAVIAHDWPVSVVAALLAYAFAAFFIAAWVGATRQASKIRARLVDKFKLGEGLSDEPIWWSILEQGPREFQKVKGLKTVEVFVNAHIAGGGRYTGVLHYFTIAPDTEACRDFAIWKARYYGPGADVPVELDPKDVVLLNSRDCLAIEVRYLEPVTIYGEIHSVQPPATVQAVGTVVPPQP